MSESAVLLIAHSSLLPQPWRCLCFELTQITRTTPLRWMILHLSQIFFTDALTFIRFQFLMNIGRASPWPDSGCPHMVTYSDRQFVRDSGRTAKGPPRPCRPAGCG